jgi:cytochrome c
VVKPSRWAGRLLGVTALLLGGCDAPPTPSAQPAAELPVDAQPDLRRGELLSLACQACHTLNPGGPHGIGPNLHRIFGRSAATGVGFEYSQALRASGLVWTPAAVDAWLADPAGFIVGNNMAFTGYQSARDRRDLVAYLIEATGGAPLQ